MDGERLDRGRRAAFGVRLDRRGMERVEPSAFGWTVGGVLLFVEPSAFGVRKGRSWVARLREREGKCGAAEGERECDGERPRERECGAAERG